MPVPPAPPAMPTGPRPAPPSVSAAGSLRPDAGISVRDLTVAYGDVVAVRDLSLDATRGIIVGLVGPSGSGKTSIVRSLTGAIKPASGAIRVLGEDPRRFRGSTRERIGYMPQQFQLQPDLTTAENVDFVGSLFGMLWRRRRKRTREVLELVNLWDARGRRASRLSGGMRRRLELACVLVHDPELLLLDEPTAGIDPLLRQRIWDELRRLRDEGRTLLVTTQYVGEAEYCDVVAILRHGRLLVAAPADEIRRRALGGEILQLEVDRPFDARMLRTVEGVVGVRQHDSNSFDVVADDVGTATPRVLAAIAETNVEVLSSREYRPYFDEVFAAVVEADMRNAPDDTDEQRQDGWAAAIGRWLR
jgi:ABC-2 type transport system ATP-binding protein